MTIRRSFLSRDAAEAFMEALEYVNDSAISDIQLIAKPNRDFVVQFTDADARLKA